MKHTNINIDSLSYTNKDFRLVMEELLALVPELTSKWNPNDSNESDPGVALLKLKAFIADKLNYNIDKNVLETFPTSVTQRGNAQKLYDLLGYDMLWYRSATVPVVFKYVQGENLEEIKENSSEILYKIPKYTTLKDDSGAIVYTLLQDAIIEGSGQSTTDIEILAIEGPIQSYTINGQEKITIQNLDSDYRLYFTESMVALNGIFISNDPSMQDLWTRVSNLETSDLNTKIYKFGVLPNSNTCYIEFPQDAANIFGGGIYIKYIISTGTAGNIALGTLSKLQYSLMANGGNNGVYYLKSDGTYSTSGDEIDLSLFTLVTNYESATNGANPETLDEAYRNYRRTIGTFNTLVTLKDYESAIYNSGVVSNAVVSDRTDDHLRSYKVKTFDINGKSEALVTTDPTTKDTSNKFINTTLVNAFNLVVYALNNVTAINTAENYNTTFKTKHDTMRLAQASVDDCKAIQHDWIDNGTQAEFLYKNLYELSGKVLTYQKVSSIEAREIEQNIQKALYRQYSSRNIDFGEALIYEDIIKTVKSADQRIKEFLLDEPNITIYAMTAVENDGVNENLQASELSIDLKVDIIAKSILAGVTPYCIFDDSIPLDFNMKPTDLYEVKNGNVTKPTTGTFRDASTSHINNIITITTGTDKVVKAGSDTLIQQNEIVQLYAPNFVTIKSLSTYLYIAFVSNTKGKKIAKDSIYQLRNDEYIYAAENKNDLLSMLGVTIAQGTTAGLATYSFGPGKIIKPSFDLPSYDGNDSNIKNLEATNTIEVQEENAVILNDKEKSIDACWSLNEKDNTLFKSENFKYFYYSDDAKTIKVDLVKDSNGNYKHAETTIDKAKVYCYAARILKNGEYFIYTDFGKSFIALLSSGTRLKIQGLVSNLENKDWSCALPNMSDLNSNGISADVSWKNLGRGYDFSVQEMRIITLGQGAKLKFTSDVQTISNLTLTNTAVQLTSDQVSCLRYKIDEYADVENALSIIDLNDSSKVDADNYSWYAFSNLLLICSADSPQELIKDSSTNTNQYVIFECADKTLYAAGGSNSIKTNIPVALTGGSNQSAELLQFDGTVSKALSAVIYENPTDQTFWEEGTPTNDAATTTNLETDAVRQFYAEDNVVLHVMHNKVGDASEKHAFLYEACVSPIFGNAILPLLIESSDKDSTAAVTLKIKDINNTWSEIPLELSNNNATKLKHNSSVIFAHLPEKIYSAAKSSGSTLAANNLQVSIEDVAANEGITVTLYTPSKFISLSDIIKTYQDGTTNKVLTRIKDLTQIKNPALPAFDFTYRVDENVLIDDPTDPESFFESNHIKNKFVISLIDTSKIGNISVAKQSRK